ncbi:hypothetical protein TrVE_jg3227 [Triparma verrucosa]|uniref:Calmodulin n=1 Tax=Triparma verrucosa TaxID=1606542 RepID=A0A9W7F1E3_9STRA|nr:hypothetical protein TrVE_jg3227 [Triparma verrucosa]
MSNPTPKGAPRQLKSSFVRPYQIPGAPQPKTVVPGQNNQNETNSGGNTGTVKPTVPTSYAESLLFHKSFYFQQRRGSLDLRSISRVDIDKVIREVDIDTLQAFLENITFSDVSADELSLYSDDTFVRLFQVTQLTLEYLINVQDTLAGNLDSLAQKYSRKKRELERARGATIEKDEEIARLKRENKRKKKTIQAYESMLRQAPPPREVEAEANEVGGSGGGGNGGSGSGVKASVGAAGGNGAVAPSTSLDDEIHIYIIRWFIGTCLDITVEGRTTVMELKSKISKITGSAMPLSEQQITLKGVNLKDGDSLYEVGVVDEGVLVLMDGEKATPAPAPAQPTIVMQAPPPMAQQPVATAPVADPLLKKQTEELHAAAIASQAELSKATQLLQEEIAKGQAREMTMKEEMERRVKALEESIRNEVKQEVMLQQKTELGSGGGAGGAGLAAGAGQVPMPKMSSAGDLESDDEEEEILTRTEIAARMKESEIRAKESEERAKAIEDEMRMSMEKLRASNDETRELKEALELAKIQREKLEQEKEQLLLKPKPSSKVGNLEDDDDNDDEEEEDGPLTFPDDSDEEGNEKGNEKGNEEEQVVVSPKAVEKKGDEDEDEDSKEASYESIWDKLDKNKDGMVTPREIIVAVRKDPEIAKALGLSDYIHEGETRDSLMALFQAMDKDSDDVVDKKEFMVWERKAHKSVRVAEGGEEGGGKEGLLSLDYEGNRIEMSLDDLKDLDEVRKSFAGQIKGASMEQVSLVKSVKEEIDGEVHTSEVEIKSLKELKDSYSEGSLKAALKLAEDNITFATVAAKMSKMDEAVEKFVSKLKSRHEREDELEAKRIKEEEEVEAAKEKKEKEEKEAKEAKDAAELKAKKEEEEKVLQEKLAKEAKEKVKAKEEDEEEEAGGSGDEKEKETEEVPKPGKGGCCATS